MDDGAAFEEKASKQREKWKAQKQQQREKKRRDSLVPDTPRPAPGAVRQKLGELARSVEPLGPGEAKRQLTHATIGAAKLLRSDVDPKDPELDDALEDAAGGLADASKVFWPIRLFIRVLIPLVIIGAFWRIGARLVTTSAWWQRRQEKKREKEEQERGTLRVLEAPGGEPAPPPIQPPPHIPKPGIYRPKRGPFR